LRTLNEAIASRTSDSQKRISNMAEQTIQETAQQIKHKKRNGSRKTKILKSINS